MRDFEVIWYNFFSHLRASSLVTNCTQMLDIEFRSIMMIKIESVNDCHEKMQTKDMYI